MTEQLIESVAQRNGFQSVPGGKYGANNGFDHVWKSPDGATTIVVDSKQFTDAGGTSLGSVGRDLQLSRNWIQQTIDALPEGSPAKIATLTAFNNGSLRVAVGGVNRATGQAVIVPIKLN